MLQCSLFVCKITISVGERRQNSADPVPFKRVLKSSLITDCDRDDYVKRPWIFHIGKMCLIWNSIFGHRFVVNRRLLKPILGAKTVSLLGDICDSLKRIGHSDE